VVLDLPEPERLFLGYERRHAGWTVGARPDGAAAQAARAYSNTGGRGVTRAMALPLSVPVDGS
jgi:hypothetical protein